ncbi:hypothetical protein [Chryseobacterium echinoideorum]|nr:hypothetical protein [Chryseobacterium echinoideorum]
MKFFIEGYNNNAHVINTRYYTPNEVHDNPELANFKLVLEKSNQQGWREP